MAKWKVGSARPASHQSADKTKGGEAWLGSREVAWWCVGGARPRRALVGGMIRGSRSRYLAAWRDGRPSQCAGGGQCQGATRGRIMKAVHCQKTVEGSRLVHVESEE